MTEGSGDAWLGEALLLPGQLLYAGAVGPAGPHAHHAVQLMASPDRALVLEDADGRRAAGASLLVPPNVPHAVVSGADRAVMIHLDPESSAGRRLAALPDRAAGAAGWAAAGSALPRLSGRPWRGLATARAVLDEVAGGGVPVAASGPRHPALARAVASLPARTGEGPVRLAEVAAAVGLSESRLTQLFRTELGLPFRAYVRWVRMRRAAGLVMAGASLTRAAHEAGFADSAHLTRTCRRMFGMAPTDITRGVRWAGAPEPGGEFARGAEPGGDLPAGPR